jgi:hypothetical protein
MAAGNSNETPKNYLSKKPLLFSKQEAFYDILQILIQKYVYKKISSPCFYIFSI